MQAFTLIEIMIVLVIVGILVSVAIPGYAQSVIRANRLLAQAQMIDIVNREQQFLFANRSYADLNTLTTSGFTVPASVSNRYTYAIAIDNTTAPSTYILTFSPIGAQLPDGNISIDSSGVKLPANKW